MSALSHAGVGAVLAHFDARLGHGRRARLPVALILAIALLLLALLAWAALAGVDRVVRTPGRIVPSGKPQMIQHLEGGIVSRVYVREGDVVKAGAPLVAVSDLAANSTRGEKQARRSGLLARVARLRAEADGASRFVAPEKLSPQAPEVIAEAEGFAARQARLRETTHVLQQQSSQRRTEANEAETRRRGLLAELEVARAQLQLVQNMVARNAGSQLELLDAQGRVQRLSTQVREAEAMLPRLSAASAELQARIAEVVAQFRSDARSALSDTEVELRRLDEDLKTDDDRVRRTVLAAPVDGTVNKVLANTLGGVVRPGETLVEITPAETAVVLETRADPAERGQLQVGQPARIRVAAFDYTLYGTLTARVKEISADSLVDERGERYFRVAFEVDATSASAFGQALGPGMTVSADIVIGRRTILQYLISPVRGLADSAMRDRH